MSIREKMIFRGSSGDVGLSVLHGKQKGPWQLVMQANLPPETEGSVGNAGVDLPMTDYGYRYIRYDSGDGDILLHVYLRNVTEVNSAVKGRMTYKFEDVKDDLISKFKESKEWQLLSNKAMDSDEE